MGRATLPGPCCSEGRTLSRNNEWMYVCEVADALLIAHQKAIEIQRSGKKLTCPWYADVAMKYGKSLTVEGANFLQRIGFRTDPSLVE